MPPRGQRAACCRRPGAPRWRHAAVAAERPRLAAPSTYVEGHVVEQLPEHRVAEAVVVEVARLLQAGGSEGSGWDWVECVCVCVVEVAVGVDGQGGNGRSGFVHIDGGRKRGAHATGARAPAQPPPALRPGHRVRGGPQRARTRMQAPGRTTHNSTDESRRWNREAKGACLVKIHRRVALRVQRRGQLVALRPGLNVHACKAGRHAHAGQGGPALRTLRRRPRGRLVAGRLAPRRAQQATPPGPRQPARPAGLPSPQGWWGQGRPAHRRGGCAVWLPYLASRSTLSGSCRPPLKR